MFRAQGRGQGKIEREPDKDIEERGREVIANGSEYLLPPEHLLDDPGTISKHSKLFDVVLKDIPVLGDVKHVEGAIHG